MADYTIHNYTEYEYACERLDEIEHALHDKEDPVGNPDELELAIIQIKAAMIIFNIDEEITFIKSLKIEDISIYPTC